MNEKTIRKAVKMLRGVIAVVIGLVWGDEGKGKICDLLASGYYHIVARFAGSVNAGHTIEINEKKYVLHIVPSGVLNPEVKNVIGNGCVFPPEGFIKEVKELEADNVSTKNIFISERAHITLPTHRLLDRASEEAKGANKIGSTLKGVTPTYRDKIGRDGLRYGDVFMSNFKDDYEALKKEHIKLMESKYSFIPDMLELEKSEKEFFEAIELIKTDYKICDTSKLINDALDAGKNVLAEGAQGALLDIEFGQYPYVTSSNTITGAVGAGLGVDPKRIGKVYGIFKAYITRVGEGPFPTELHDSTGDLIRENGHEFGATTGRPRRCGWQDLVLLRQQCIVNGVTDLTMMKGDILCGIPEIKACTGYRLPDGSIVNWAPYDLSTAEPIYKVFPGWNMTMDEMQKCRSVEDLPQEFIDYVNAIVEYCNVNIHILSVGPKRDQSIIIE